MSKRTKDALTKLIKKALLARGEIVFAYIHGSFLSLPDFRDVDLALYVNPATVSSQEAFDYAFRLSADLSHLTSRDIDVQIMNYAPLGFRHSVFKNGRFLFSRDDSLRADLIEQTVLEYVAFYELSLQYMRDLAL
ncbi:MAG: nucleotidyltransferase domain-containing protein [Clostridiales bacterium]|nr:nucleotidyltransferase domain-containing protein [Clostridiales bacterium]